LVGILLVTHNGLGDSLLDCVKHVLGEVPANVRSLSVLASDDPSLKETEGNALIAQLDNGGGVLVLSDIFGATPSNIARRLCRPPHVRGVAGVNLPMLLRVVCYKDKTLEDLVYRAIEGGRECIIDMSSDMEGCNAAAGSANY
jgi:PTS system mannose-specific IIA component